MREHLLPPAGPLHRRGRGTACHRPQARRTLARAAVAFLLSLMLPGPGLSAQEPQPSDEEPMALEARPLERPVAPFIGLPRSDYRIGRQDLLEISVFDVEELSQTVRVADDGSITMPLLGRLEVAGLTKTELERKIARLLEERYVRDPQVTVFVKEYESKKIAVSGAVKNPGSYEMLGRKTLLELLSMAGGLDKEMGKEIIIFRRNEETTRRIAVELERLVYEADPSLNLVVEAGDIIYVPAVEKVRIFVSGAVRNPDLYEVPREEPVTVLKAITLAGGTTDRAALKKVQVIRTDRDGNRITLVVNLKKVKRGKAEDPILQKDDLVLVPESFF
jgi:polysaccharide export outer membrane protein